MARSFLVPALVLLAAVCVAYAPAFSNGFVWDDTALVLRDPLIRSWRLIPEGFRHFLFTDATASQFYRPLQRLVNTVDYALFGFAPWGWHLTSVLWHGAAAVALFALLRQWLQRTGVAMAGALLWAVHPVHTSAVCYVAGRADSLAALCVFLALWWALRSPTPWPAACCALGAMLAKEQGAIILALLPLVLWQTGRRAALGRLAVPCLLMLAVVLVLRWSAAGEPSPQIAPVVPPQDRPVLALRALGEYAGLLVAPVTLRMERELVAEYPQALLQMLGGALFVAALGWWALRARRSSGTQAPVPALLLAAATAWLPISGLLPLNATVAEHWLYLPSAFLCGAVACAVPWRPVLLVWLVLLGARTWVRTFDWRDQRTFLERTIAAGGGSSRMWSQLGNLELASGNLAAARAAYLAALDRMPGQPFALLGLAHAEIRAGELAAARLHLDQVGNQGFLRSSVLAARAVLEAANGSDPLPWLEAAVRANPADWTARRRLVAHLLEGGEVQRAVRELRPALEQAPWRGETWKWLGKALEQAGLRGEAARAYREAVLRDVHDTEARAAWQTLRSSG